MFKFPVSLLFLVLALVSVLASADDLSTNSAVFITPDKRSLPDAIVDAILSAIAAGLNNSGRHKRDDDSGTIVKAFAGFILNDFVKNPCVMDCLNSTELSETNYIQAICSSTCLIACGSTDISSVLSLVCSSTNTGSSDKKRNDESVGFLSHMRRRSGGSKSFSTAISLPVILLAFV
ncbi:hypothetical protein HDU82_001200 [Entophlyctis luteolus]|nr:hypothetical protein HDU82_001200 [Entophlyctis luteolus]